MTTLHTAIVRRHGRAVLRLTAASLLAATLAGCYQTHLVAGSHPFNYQKRHPITLREGARTVRVFIGRDGGGLTPDQRADVLAFTQAWRREANSGIVIDVPHGGPTERAVADSTHEIEAIMTAAGVPRRAVYLHRYRASGSSLVAIKLRYARLSAHAGPCGYWPNDIGPAGGAEYVNNADYWNFGCATQRNLAAMVDDPADLVQPRGETAAYTARRSVMLDKYRQGQNPSGTYVGYEKGTISDLGK